MTALLLTLFAGIAIGYLLGARFHPPRNRQTSTPTPETRLAPDREWDLFRTLHQDRFEDTLRERRRGRGRP